MNYQSPADWAPLPGPVATLFDRVLAAMEDAGISFSLGGSAVTGDLDRWSDLDLKVPGQGRRAVQVIRSTLRPLNAQVLSHYAGVAVNRPDLQVMYIETQNFVAKIDVDAEFALAGADDAGDWVLTWAPPWIYQISTRIARGEYFAAARAIDQYREDVLIPLIDRRLKLGLTGHRRIESRLPAEELERISRTYPLSASESELTKAWNHLRDVVSNELRRGGHSDTLALFERFTHLSSQSID